MKISFKNHLRDRYFRILAWFWGPQASLKSPKIVKKASRTNSKKIEDKKHRKSQKKALSWFAWRNAQADGEDMEGGKRLPRQPKTMQKVEDGNWRKRLKAWRLEDENKKLKRRRRTGKFLGSSSTPHRGAAERYAHSARLTLSWRDLMIRWPEDWRLREGI